MGEYMKLGIIGGLGPMATAYFMEMITEMTLASKDQDHIEMIIMSVPSTPDRTAFILGESTEDPLPIINETAYRLEKAGADIIAIPCITAHCFHEKLCRNVDVKILNAIEETCKELSAKGACKVGIMATSGTLRCGLFRDAFIKEGIEPIEPDAKTEKLIMDLIYKDIKAGRAPNEARFKAIMKYFGDKGADKVVLGCTELSLLERSDLDLHDTVDVMRVLARKSITECGYKVRKEYL